MSRVPAMVMAALVALTACSSGGGDALTPRNNFEQLEAAAIRFDERTDTLSDEQPDEPTLQNLKDQFAAGRTITIEFVGALEQLVPPGELREEHEAAVAAGRAVLTAAGDFAQELNGVETPDDLTAAIRSDAGTEMDEASERFSNTCEALEAAAGERDIDVDLRCN